MLLVIVVPITVSQQIESTPNLDSCSNTFSPVNFPWSVVAPFNFQKHLTKGVWCIPTSVVNDANAAALAENRYGIGRSVNSFVIITIGTDHFRRRGIVINNKLFDGSYGYAGRVWSYKKLKI